MPTPPALPRRKVSYEEAILNGWLEENGPYVSLRNDRREPGTDTAPRAAKATKS